MIAVTVSFPEDGITGGAVYRPAEVTVPATAVQLVAPGAVNCTVLVSMTLTDAGEMTGAPVGPALPVGPVPPELPDPTGTVIAFPYTDEGFLTMKVALAAGP